MSILPKPQSGQSSLYSCSNVWPTAARIANAETLTYSESALPPLSATTLLASILPIGGVLLRRAGVEQHVLALLGERAARHDLDALGLGGGDRTGQRVLVGRVDDHRVRAVADGGLERVLDLLRRAVGADLLDRPAEQLGALGEDRALHCARLDAAADERDLLARRDRLVDRLGLRDLRRTRRRLRRQLLGRADISRAAAGGRAAAAVARCSPQPVATNSSAARPASASRVWTDLSRPVMLDMEPLLRVDRCGWGGVGGPAARAVSPRPTGAWRWRLRAGRCRTRRPRGRPSPGWRRWSAAGCR